MMRVVMKWVINSSAIISDYSPTRFLFVFLWLFLFLNLSSFYSSTFLFFFIFFQNCFCQFVVSFQSVFLLVVAIYHPFSFSLFISLKLYFACFCVFCPCFFRKWLFCHTHSIRQKCKLFPIFDSIFTYHLFFHHEELFPFYSRSVVQNSQECRLKYKAIRSSIYSFARTALLFACSALFARALHALTRSLACSMLTHSLPH